MDLIERQKELVESARVHVYSVHTETGAFLSLSKKMGVSFTALLIPLTAQAIARGCKVQDGTVKIMVPADLRQVYDMKTVVNFSDGICFAMDETLRRETPCPRAGDAYAVGAGAPYEVWIWDETGRRWVNAGALLQSVAQGPAGVTFVPSVDEAGNLSWTNDGELENPAARNIMGRTGAEGAVGPAGKSAYESACEAGYTGEEEAFLEALAVLPGHADRHGPGGPDPLVVRTGNLEDGAVTWEKIGTGGVRTENLADGAVTGVYTVSAGTGEAWRGESAPYTMTLAVPGLKETDRVIADLVPSGAPDVAQGELNAFSQIYKMETAADAVTLYAADRTSTGIVIQLLAVRR